MENECTNNYGDKITPKQDIWDGWVAIGEEQCSDSTPKGTGPSLEITGFCIHFSLQPTVVR
jgi:hypothetical protein